MLTAFGLKMISSSEKQLGEDISPICVLRFYCLPYLTILAFTSAENCPITPVLVLKVTAQSKDIGTVGSP